MKDLYRPSGKSYLHVNDEKILKVNKEYISYLKTLAKEDGDQKCTMCLHNDIRSHTHEMINVYPKYTYVRPHSHSFKTETKIIIEGTMLVVIFDEGGEILDKFMMDRNDIFTSRLDKGIIHTNIPLTDVIFHEVIEGPFIGKDDSIFPEWASEKKDKESIIRWINKINIEKNNIL